MSLVQRRTDGSIGLMGHVIADYPDADTVRAMIAAMVGAGVELIEIQIPFSEPMADGPLFMAANHEALANGVDLGAALRLMSDVSSDFDIPFVFMSYANVLFNKGYEDFIRAAQNAGARGVIVPDLPVDYASDYLKHCQSSSFHNIPVVSPNISDERLRMVCESASGLIYVAARQGVTGASTTFGDHVDHLLKRIRSFTDLPLAVGFGVRTAVDVNFLKGRADMAVIGSRGLEVYHEAGLKGVSAYWQNLMSKNDSEISK